MNKTEEIVKAQGIDLTSVKQFLDGLVQRWRVEHPNTTGWSVVKGKVPLREVLSFLIESTDEFVVMVGSLLGNSVDVKTVVLELVTKLYDTVIEGVLPVWLKPLSATIKYVIVDIILSNLVDYLIKQYKTGARVAMSVQQGEVVCMMEWKAQ